MLKYVGIRPFSEKEKLLRKGTPEVGEVRTEDLTFDCVRHLEFLAAVADGMEEDHYPETLYWQYLHFEAKRPSDYILKRCGKFRRLFEKIRHEGLSYPEGYVSVTDNGMRLDGSHRASIARVLGLETMKVKMYRWEEIFSPRRIRHICEEAQVKREVQLRYMGRRVEDPATGKYIGKVVIAHCTEVRKGFFRCCWNPVLVVRNDQGELAYVPVDQAAVR